MRKLTVAAFLTVAILLLFAGTGGQAAPGDAINTLQDFKGFLVTGNYVVGGVDLTEETNPIVDGFSTGTISMGDQIPANAEVIAAYLFWETITIDDDPLTTEVNESLQQAGGVKFRGNTIEVDDVLTVKRTFEPLGGSTASCWSSGVPLVMNMFRADVLRFLPVQLDVNDDPAGTLLVNDSDLVAHGADPHTVTLPVRSGNQIPESAGASLFVAYRVPDPTEPLRKIVIYDGVHIKPALNVDMVQTLQGFYQSASNPSARLTHIGGSGQPNNNDKVLFNGVVLLSNPFNTPGTASQRGWTTATAPVPNSAMALNAPHTSGVYGETATMEVKHQPSNGGYDCLSWGAVIFSTAVKDADGDGLPDGLEDALAGRKDPDGVAGKDLPNLKAMGAGSDQKDFFVEINAMKADPNTSYGSAEAQYDLAGGIPSVTDTAGHHHRPTPQDLKMAGDAYAARGIRAHFDVGNVAAYHALGTVPHSDWVDDYASPVADQYLVGNGIGTNVATLARGGEIIKEVACDPEVNNVCHFPDYPGTVLWKIGLQAYRDAMVRDDGTELTVEQLTDPSAPGYFDWNASTQKRRRFDPDRKGLFHYLLYAHAVGVPKSLPCLEEGEPAGYFEINENGVGTCTDPDAPVPDPEAPEPDPYGQNPAFEPLEYHVPISMSGIADLPGGDSMVTLGLWDEFVGRPYARAGTAFHELGHNLELWHGGLPAIWGNKALSTANYFEPNCKPNHLSSMSYLFQVHGLFDANDELHVDYSGTAHGANNPSGIDEALQLEDPSALSPAPTYQPAWFAPANSLLASQLGVSKAKRFCSGNIFGTTEPAPMARVHAASPTATIDWDGDLVTVGPDIALASQDVNFDGVTNSAPALLNGFNDWDNVRLNAIGGAWQGALAGSLESIAETNVIVSNFADGFLKGGFLKGGFLKGGFLKGGFLKGGFLKGGFLKGGFLKGGFLKGGFLKGGQDVTYNHAKEMGKTRPHAFKLCIVGQDPDCPDADPSTLEFHRVAGAFNAPPFGTFTGYEVQRKRASAGDETFESIETDVELDTDEDSPTFNKLTFIDYTELANAVGYAYRVRGLAAHEDDNTGWATDVITAVNDAPVASPDGPDTVYQVENKKVLNVSAAQGVLANDLDHDSPTAYRGRRAELVSGPTAGTLSCGSSLGICENGSFTYTPPKGGSFVGLVTFTYKADDGLSSDSPQVPLSGFSDTVTVTINVFKK